jgi:hypothetical protein
MKKTTIILLLMLECMTQLSAQDIFAKKTGVSPSFLTKHGTYYSIENTEAEDGMIFHSMLFYNDGTFYIGGQSFNSKISMLRILNDMNNPNHDANNLILHDAWGSYYISNDTIYMQRFSYTPGTEFSTKTTGMVAVISSDSSFRMIKETCEWCGINEYFGVQGHVYSKPIPYAFFHLDRLPDPSLAWFRKKQWFVDGNAEQAQTFAITR